MPPPFAVAEVVEFPVKVEPLMVSISLLKIAPPPPVPAAVLFENVEFVIVIVPCRLRIAPPPFPLAATVCILPVNVESVMDVTPGAGLELLIAPPPFSVAPPIMLMLFVKVQPATVSDTMLVPLPLEIAPPEALLVFEAKVMFVTVKLPAFWIAPLKPPASVRVIPLIDAVLPAMLNIPTALLPLTVSKFAPGPVIVKESPVAGLMTITDASVIVCGVLKDELKTIVSEPAALFESVIACRRLPAPVLFVFITVKVAA